MRQEPPQGSATGQAFMFCMLLEAYEHTDSGCACCACSMLCGTAEAARPLAPCCADDQGATWMRASHTRKILCVRRATSARAAAPSAPLARSKCTVYIEGEATPRIWYLDELLGAFIIYVQK